MSPERPNNPETALPTWAATDFEGMLVAGEEVIWAGKPARLSSKAWSLLIIASAIAATGLLMLTFALLAAYSIGAFGWRLHGWAAMPFMHVGIAALVLGIFFFIACPPDRRILYVLTNRRVFIWPTPFSGGPRILYPTNFTECSIRNERDGVGDLVLLRELIHTSNGGEIMETGFLRIRDVRRVEELVKKTLSPQPPTQPAPPEYVESHQF